MCVLQSKQKIELVNRDSKPENDFFFQTNNNIKTTIRYQLFCILSIIQKVILSNSLITMGLFQTYKIFALSSVFSCLTKAGNEFLLHYVTLHYIYLLCTICITTLYNTYYITFTQGRQKYELLLMLLLVLYEYVFFVRDIKNNHFLRLMIIDTLYHYCAQDLIIDFCVLFFLITNCWTCDRGLRL